MIWFPTIYSPFGSLFSLNYFVIFAAWKQYKFTTLHE